VTGGATEGKNIDHVGLRGLCESLARGAGQIASGGRVAADRQAVRHATKSSTTDIATEFDRAAESFVVDSLRRDRPADAITGEEGTNDSGTSGYEWFIDPIDGTTSFVYGLAGWACSIAVAFDGEMIAGAVMVPMLDELFSAELGSGAFCNGRPIAASAETDLSLALVGTGFSYIADRRRAQAQQLVELIADIRDIRRSGSAALDLCLVACGRLDIYYERFLNSWDAAAGELIAREAGATTSNFSGNQALPAELVVAAPGIHSAFIEALRNT
jgi:myo-inositol-1(or 4)-monophosphatase